MSRGGWKEINIVLFLYYKKLYWKTLFETKKKIKTNQEKKLSYIITTHTIGPWVTPCTSFSICHFIGNRCLKKVGRKRHRMVLSLRLYGQQESRISVISQNMPSLNPAFICILATFLEGRFSDGCSVNWSSVLVYPYFTCALKLRLSV